MRPVRVLVLSAVTAGALVAATAAPAVAESSHTSFHGRPVFSLSLGDSLAYGYQQALFNAEVASGDYDPSAFVGYAGLLPDPLSVQSGKHVVEVNYGCPGETTTSFMTACVFTAPTSTGGDGAPVDWLHDPYTGPQETAALDFLRSHAGRVSDVTIDLGSNDLRQALFSCIPAPTTCQAVASQAAQRVIGNLVTFVMLMERADPGVHVAVANFYNPEVVDPRLGTLAPLTDVLVQPINAALAAAMGSLASSGVPVAVADAYGAINGTNPTTEDTRVCSLTNMCTPLLDIHPSDAGYAALSQAFLTALDSL